MDLETLNWDTRLCNFFNIPSNILPKIQSNCEIYGYIKMNGLNVLDGVPIASCLATTNSAMLGLMMNDLRPGQIQCHVENDCSVMFNTGEEIVYSDNDLLTTVGFQLGPTSKPYYCLEGFVGNSCGSYEWLKNSILPAESNNNFNDDNISPVSSFIGTRKGTSFKKLREDELIFVPALRGLCAPSLLYQAKGFLSGISINTTSQQLFTAAKESICFQTKTILDSIRKDCKTWPGSFNKLVVGGEFSENVDFLQILADLCSLTVERPQISAPVSLGKNTYTNSSMFL
jgi:glycerol kinase